MVNKARIRRKKVSQNPNKRPTTVDIESSWKSLLDRNQKVLELLDKRGQSPILDFVDLLKKIFRK